MYKTNWQKIYLDYSPKLLGICRRYITDLQTAEDLLQDSFIVAMQKSHQLKDENALFGWLKTIVVNSALQHLRKNSKEIFVSTEISEIPESLNEMNHSASEKNTFFAYDFTREELLKSIDNLPSHHRSVFNLYFIEKNSHAEISKLLGINVNTSKSHLLRAKKSVQNYLMNNIANTNTPKNKKKTTQLLVFLGFGGWAWAQTFQSKFSDFSIPLSQEFVIPDDGNLEDISFSGSNKSFQKKLIITATLFLTLLISVVVHKEIQSGKSKIVDSKSLIKTETQNNAVEDLIPEIKPDIAEKTNFSDEKQNENSTNTKPESKEIISKTVLSIEKKSPKKDSVEIAPQKVIVVKKIIQRDTIFIER